MKWVANGRWWDSAVIGLLLAASLSFPMIGFRDSGAAAEQRSVAVLFAPWVSSSSAINRIAATEARILGVGALPFVVIAEPRDANFAKQAAAAGALLTFTAPSFIACLGWGVTT